MLGEVHVVLDRYRHSQQGESLAGRDTPVGLGCLRASGLGTHHAEGVQCGLGRLDVLERLLHQLRGADAPFGQCRHTLHRICLAD